MEPKKIKSVTVSTFPPSICHTVMGPNTMTLCVCVCVCVFFECWVLSQLLHSSLSLSPRGSLVPLHFLPLEWFHLHIWNCWYFSQQSWFQLVIHPAWHFIWFTLHRSEIRVSICILDQLLSQFEQIHCFMSGSNCCFSTCIQVSQEVGKVFPSL